MIDMISAGFWLAGATLALLAAVGVLRMPDLFLRMQASTKASTLGLGCLLIGAALQLSDVGSIMRAACIGAFVMLTSPIAGHVIARAAYYTNVPLVPQTLDERDPTRTRTEERESHGADRA
jgi:multicomponent Na+:H+ antiporter subunit G